MTRPNQYLASGPWARIAWAASLSLLITGCISAKIVKLDRKTQLENQILGTFQRLEEDLILASSVRGDRAETKLSPLQQEAVAAMMSREFFRDDIEDLKGKQVLGEGNSGRLQILITAGEPEELKRVERLVTEENKSREIILSRVIQLNRELSDKDLPRLWSIFHRLNAGTAQSGHKVQLENGNWQVVRKSQAANSGGAKAVGK